MSRNYRGEQLPLFASASPPRADLERARAEGRRGSERAARRAERDVPTFSDRAVAFFEAQLAAGPVSGEDLVDRAKRAGLAGSGDDRCFGRAFRMLAERGAVTLDSSLPRRKGHGSSGGRLWAAKGWRA